MERRESVLVGVVRVGTHLEKERNGLGASVQRGAEERTPTLLITDAMIAAPFEEQPRRLRAVERRGVERSAAKDRVGAVGVRARVEKERKHRHRIVLDVAAEGALEREAAANEAVRVGAAPQELAGVLQETELHRATEGIIEIAAGVHEARRGEWRPSGAGEAGREATSGRRAAAARSQAQQYFEFGSFAVHVRASVRTTSHGGHATHATAAQSWRDMRNVMHERRKHGS